MNSNTSRNLQNFQFYSASNSKQTKFQNDTARKNTYIEIPESTENNPPPVESQRKDFNAAFLGKMQYPEDKKAEDKKVFRPYQLNIVKTCLQSNTLVCLPTGLGKTFIASVIIYNFHLWFSGKIFFFAPTKPLVNQQKSAFLNMFKDLENIVTEMNGAINANKRKQIYSNNKIFFMTPQTLDNDLSRGLIECDQVSLLIFDEAHKAQKKFSYTNIVSKISEKAPTNLFRTIALSASPGSNNEAIQNVIDSLKIKKIELRTENDPDLKPFLFNKDIKIVEIQSNNNINKLKTIVDKLIFKRVEMLKKYKILNENINLKYLNRSKILEAMENFRNNKTEFENEIGPMMIKEVWNSLSIVMRLISGKTLLENQGIDSFKESIKKFFEDRDENKTGSKNKKFNNSSNWSNFKTPSNSNYSNTPVQFTPAKFNNPPEISASKRNLMQSDEFKELLQELFEPHEMPGATHTQSLSQTKLPSSFTPLRKFDGQEKAPSKDDHPKLLKLTEILRERHFEIRNNSKVIIFTQYKDTAREIEKHVKTCGHFCDIPFHIFTGQDKKFSRKDQLEVIQRFRDGEIKVLIATSVAEEGLDIGEVDLIICYDVASTSPIKMIQRFGRTGRKRNGCVIVLASKGEEKSKFHRALYKLSYINKELNKLKYDVEKCKIKFYAGNSNVLLIPKSYVENLEYFDLASEVIENTEDIISDSEPEDDEDEGNNQDQDKDEDQEQEQDYDSEVEIIEDINNLRSKNTKNSNNASHKFSEFSEEKKFNNINTSTNSNFNKFTENKTKKFETEQKPQQHNNFIINFINNNYCQSNMSNMSNMKNPSSCSNPNPIQNNSFRGTNSTNSNFRNKINVNIPACQENLNSVNLINPFMPFKQPGNLTANKISNAGISQKFDAATPLLIPSTPSCPKLSFRNDTPNFGNTNNKDYKDNKDNKDNKVNYDIINSTNQQASGTNSKPLLKFSVLNKKTNSNNRYLTKSKIEGGNKEDLTELPVINLNDYAISSALQEFAQEIFNENEKTNLKDPEICHINENNSPMKIDDLDLDDLLNDYQDQSKESEVLIINEYKEPQEIQNSLTNSINKNSTGKINIDNNVNVNVNFNVSNDEILNILERESFANNIISFMKQEENRDSKKFTKNSILLPLKNSTAKINSDTNINTTNNTTNNDELFNIIERESFMNNIISFMNQEESRDSKNYVNPVMPDMKENIHTIQTVQTIQTIQTVQTFQTIHNVPSNINKISDFSNQNQHRQLFKSIENDRSEILSNTCNAPIQQSGFKEPSQGYFSKHTENSHLKRKYATVGFTPGKGEFYNSEPCFKSKK